MFMNLHTLKYDDQLIDWFRLDPAKVHLPKIVSSSDVSAFGSLSSGVLKGFPITGCLGDQSAGESSRIIHIESEHADRCL